MRSISLPRRETSSASVASAVIILLLTLLVNGPLLSPTVEAAGPVCTVNAAGGGADYTTVQAAIDDPGCSTINVAAGTYVGALSIGRNLTLNGAGPRSTDTVIDADGAFRAVTIDFGVTASINLLKVTGGNDENFFGGAGIANFGSLTIDEVTVSGNRGSYAGFGIQNGDTLVVKNSTISDNSAAEVECPECVSGAGIGNFANLTVVNSTIVNNDAGTGTGGGIWTTSDTASATIINSTIAGNRAASGAGVYVVESSTAHLSNTILDNNLLVSGGEANCARQEGASVIANEGSNIDSGTTCGFGSANQSMSSTDPLLGSLQNNGGPTDTLALGAGSPGIDQGSAAVCAASPVDSRDQRRVQRPRDGDDTGSTVCDIGPFEADGALGSGETTPPETTLDSARDGNDADVPDLGALHTSAITFTFSGTDNIDVTGFECRLNSETFAPCTSPKTYSGLASGAYTFRVRAFDADGNADPSPVVHRFFVPTPTGAPVGTVDQEQGVLLHGFGCFPPVYPHGQTFVPTADNMTGIDLWFRAPAGIYTFQIRNMVNGAALGTIIYEHDGTTAPAAAGIRHFKLPSRIALTPGVKHAVLVIDGTASNPFDVQFGQGEAGTNPYGSGMSVCGGVEIDDGDDLFFRTYAADTVGPTADIVDVTPDPRNTSVSSIAITFSESVTGFDLADLELTHDGSPIDLNSASLGGGGSSYTLSGLSGLTGDAGTYVLTLSASGSGIVDVDSNTLAGDASDSWVVDLTAPTADIGDVTPDPRDTSVSSIDITFSEPVTGFDLDDLSLTRDGGPVDLDSASFSGSGSSYTVSNLSSLTSSAGAYVLTLSASGSGIADANGNALAGDASESWVIDLTAPTVAMTSAAPDPTSVSAIPVTVTFSESVTGFAAGDIVASNGTVDNFSGSGADYSFDLTPSGPGPVTANIAADVAQDAAGNGNTAAPEFSRTFESSSSPAAQLITDPTDPSKTALLVTGTAEDDTIKLNKSGTQIEVIFNGTSLGTFAPSGLLIILGEDGDDKVTVALNLLTASIIYGGAGNDIVASGNGTSIMIGGEGQDRLTSGSARDILIGGQAADVLKGNNGDDILIAGDTSFDAYSEANAQALEAIRAEWTRTDLGYQARINHLTGATPGGLNGTNLLQASGPGQTVFNDTRADKLTGNNGLDWFLLNFTGSGRLDNATDRSASEVRTDL